MLQSLQDNARFQASFEQGRDVVLSRDLSRMRREESQSMRQARERMRLEVKDEINRCERAEVRKRIEEEEKERLALERNEIRQRIHEVRS